jgi:hypothetical protein
MKLPLLLVCTALLAGSPLLADTAAAPAVPASTADSSKIEFRGMLIANGERRFMLSSAGGAASEWLGLGDSFQDWNLVSFGEKDSTLVLKKSDGTERDLVLASSKVGAADPMATVADAQRVLEKIHFGEMLGKIIESQQKAQVMAMRAQLAKNGMSADQIDKIIAQQTSVMKRMWAGIDMKALQGSMAQIYSEEFTADQLNGISQFYDTSAGQAILDKTPEIQQKLMQVIAPQMMAARQKIMAEQKAAKAAAQQQAQQKAAASPAPAALAAPSTPPPPKL